MNKLQKQKLINALRRTAPVLRLLGDSDEIVPKRVMQALDRALDEQFPPTPQPSEQQEQEFVLNLLVEQPMHSEEIVTVMRKKSAPRDQKHVANLLNRMTESGLIAEVVPLSSPRSGWAYDLTEAGRRMLGLPVKSKEVVLVVQTLRSR